jgi:hypothetical protein
MRSPNPKMISRLEEIDSKPYIELVADDPAQGWATVPPGTRKSTYDNADYQKAAPFAAQAAVARAVKQAGYQKK